MKRREQINLGALLEAAVHTGPVLIRDWSMYDEAEHRTEDHEYDNATKAFIACCFCQMSNWTVDIIAFLAEHNQLIIECNMPYEERSNDNV